MGSLRLPRTDRDSRRCRSQPTRRFGWIMHVTQPGLESDVAKVPMPVVAQQRVYLLASHGPQPGATHDEDVDIAVIVIGGLHQKSKYGFSATLRRLMSSKTVSMRWWPSGTVWATATAASSTALALANFDNRSVPTFRSCYSIAPARATHSRDAHPVSIGVDASSGGPGAVRTAHKYRADASGEICGRTRLIS